jgi:hypothetical protein
MKILLLLENNEYVEIDPAALQLRQQAPGQSSVGFAVNVPLKNDDGTPQLDAEGKPVLAPGFYSIINYEVDLVVPTAQVPLEVPALEAAASAPGPVAVKSNSKKKSAKKR